MSTELVEDFLEHHGIKGMHWGQRKTEPVSSKEQQLNNLDKKINSYSREKNYLRRVLPGSVTIAGAGARAQAAKSVMKLKKEKNSDGSTRLVTTDKSPKVTDKNRISLERKVTRRALATNIAAGALFVTAVLGGSKLASKKLGDPALASQIKAGATFVAGMQILRTVTISAGVMANNADAVRDQKSRDLKKQRNALLKKS